MAQERHLHSIWLYAMLASSLMLPIGSLMDSWCFDMFPSELNLWWTPFLKLLGCICGPLIAGFNAQLYGRKSAILTQGFVFMLVFILTYFLYNPLASTIASFLTGICFIGMFTALILYFVEIGQCNNRGIFCAAVPLFFCTGRLFSSGNKVLLYKIIVQIIFIVLCYCFYRLAPETLQFLRSRSKREEAEMSIKILRCKDCCSEKSYEPVGIEKNCYKTWLSAILLCILTNLSGSHVAIGTIRDKIVLENNVPLLIIGVSAVTASLITFLFIDRVGRKTFLIGSTLGTLLAQLIVGAFMNKTNLDEHEWLLVPTITLLNWFYWMGLTSVPFTITAELQFTDEKPVLLGIAAAFGWLMQLFIFLYYPCLGYTILGINIFWAFPLINLLSIFFYCFYIPETAWKTVRDPNKMYHGQLVI